MAKRKPIIEMLHYGIYRNWDARSKDLPRFTEKATLIYADVGVEFGYVVNIKGGKNQQLHYCIDHPGIQNSEGQRRPPFDGTVYIKSNDWDFYLGDTIWEPVADKLGDWRLTLTLNGKTIAEKTFELHRDEVR